MSCLKCCDTGITTSGDICDCGYKESLVIPSTLEIPTQYQSIRFDKSFLPKWLQTDYGAYIENLLKDIQVNLHSFQKNILICAPPNSGKTVFAYTIYSFLYAKGHSIPALMDILELRDIMIHYYSNEDEIFLLSRAKIILLKIPQDLPNKFAEIMSSIVERRVRNNASTIFLFSGSQEDLVAQDKFGKFQALIGDGSYHSIYVKSWKKQT